MGMTATPVLRMPHNVKDALQPRGLAAVLFAVSLLGLPQPTLAQRDRPLHHRYDGSWAPGFIGQQQQRGDLRRIGYVQPVEIMLPDGAKVAMAEGGAFTAPQPAPLKVGLQLARVYRFQVSHIHLREGAEIFPTIEVIDRLHPPEGAKWRFPVPVQITRDEIDLALAGKFVTRVIYVENPTTALAHHVDRRTQPYFELRPDADPVRVADQLGRPIAILRIGSRLPEAHGPSDTFLYGSPPWERFPGEVEVEQPFEIVPTPAPPRINLPRNRQ